MSEARKIVALACLILTELATTRYTTFWSVTARARPRRRAAVFLPRSHDEKHVALGSIVQTPAGATLPTLAVSRLALYAGPMLSHGRRSERMAVLALLVVTAVWGSTFFLIKDLVTRIPVADLLAVRFGLASLALAVLVGPRHPADPPDDPPGCGLGLLYGVAQILQTVGLAHTTASVSGFITGLYVVATPVLPR